MAKRKYVVSSPEGAAWAEAEEGSIVELELDDDQEVALIAAGWLAPDKKAKEAAK